MRHSSCVISRFTRVGSRDVVLGAAGWGAARPGCADRPGQSPAGLARPQLVDRAASILEFYGSLIGEAPYPSFTLA